jgi:hypothetical protein
MLRAISVARWMSLEAPVVTVRAEGHLLGDPPAEQAADLADDALRL